MPLSRGDSRPGRVESTFEREIGQQPGVLRALLESAGPSARRVARAWRRAGVDWLLIAARGSSDNAARYAQYVFGSLVGIPTALATPSLLTRYGARLRLGRCLVLAISQSGQSPDIVAVVQEGRRQQRPTLAITNDPSSPLAAAAGEVLDLGCGPEQAVAATKTYTAQLLCIALLASHWIEDAARLGELERVPDAVAEALRAGAGLEDGATEDLARARACVTLGRGYNYSTAFEIALKLKELAYLLAEPYSPADFRHGPVALVEKGFPVLAIAPRGRVLEDQLGLLATLKERGASLLVISEEVEALRLATHPVGLPGGLPEWLTPIPATVLGQLLALQVTLARGLDPDHPRGLGKVTRTR